MKRSLISTLGIVALLAVAFSCSKDDPAAPAAPSVVGTWQFESYVATGCDDPTDEENEECTDDTLEDCGSLIITATNYTYTPAVGSGGSAETGTYSITGTAITLTPTVGSASNYTITVSATTLLLVDEDDTTGCTETTTFKRK